MDWEQVAAIVGLVMAAGLLITLLAGRGRRSTGPVVKSGVDGPPIPPIPPGPPMIPAAPSEPTTELLPEDLQFHLYRELGKGRKIQAVKLVRQHTRLGLKEAKEIVDALEAGWRPSPDRQVPGGGTGDDGSLSERVRAFEQAGDHVAAIALVCSQTGMSTDEAERFVAALVEPGGGA